MKWRWFGSLEALLGVAIVTGASIMIPGQWGFLHLQPHPLWIVILAIALRYGAPSGYVAGVAAAASQCVMLWSRSEAPFQSISEHDLIQPFLFVAVAIVISHALHGQRQRLTLLEGDNRATTDTLHAITQRYTEVHAVKVELEKQIVGLPDTIMTLYEMAKSLETLNIEALYPTILTLVDRFLQTESCTLYRLEAGQLRTQAHLPTTEYVNPVTMLAENALLEQVIRTRQVITVRDRLVREGPEALASEPVVAAGPLLDSDGAVIGIIAIERIPFLKLTPTNVRLFSMILDWGATALQTATEYERTHERSLVDDTTGVYVAAHTMRLVREESLRSQRYQLPLSLVTMRVEHLHAIRADMLANVLTTVTEVARLSLRTVDIIGHHQIPGMFILILPMTDAEQANVVATRISDNIRAIGVHPYLTSRPLAVQVSVLTRDAEVNARVTQLPRVATYEEVAETDAATHALAPLLFFPDDPSSSTAAGD